MKSHMLTLAEKIDNFEKNLSINNMVNGYTIESFDGEPTFITIRSGVKIYKCIWKNIPDSELIINQIFDL